MDYFDFFHPPFSSLATIVANGLSVNQILLRRSPPGDELRHESFSERAGRDHQVIRVSFYLGTVQEERG